MNAAQRAVLERADARGLERRLALGLSLEAMKEYVDGLPVDAVKQCNDKIKRDQHGKPKYPENTVLKGCVNQYHFEQQCIHDGRSGTSAGTASRLSLIARGMWSWRRPCRVATFRAEALACPDLAPLEEDRELLQSASLRHAADPRASAAFAKSRQAWGSFLHVLLGSTFVQPAAGLIAQHLAQTAAGSVPGRSVVSTTRLASTSIAVAAAPATFGGGRDDRRAAPGGPGGDPPEEAAKFVQLQEAGFVERNLGAVAWAAGDFTEAVLICTFNRYPAALRQALDEGPALRQCRAALEAHGYAWALPGGAKVFVHPDQYEHGLRRLPEELRHRDVVIARSLEHLLEEDFGMVESHSGSFRGAWVAARRQLPLSTDSDAHSRDAVPSNSTHEEEELHARLDALLLHVRVCRTFLCAVPAPRSALTVGNARV